MTTVSIIGSGNMGKAIASVVSKGGNGTVYMPLQPDDPLYVEGSHTNFMALTRVSPDAVNLTTAWVDQNQTYTSHPSHQVFLREYTDNSDGRPVAIKHKF